MASPPIHPDHRRTRPTDLVRPAFTLVELMISIALVVVLILGVNQVFQSTLTAVGAGQAFVASIRDGRAAQTAFQSDLAGAAGDGPFFIIHSGQAYAFRNAADLAADKDQDASTYTITAADDTGVRPSTYNNRNHRQDVLSFFARGQYPAQTGDTSYVYPNSSSEARVWYGFLELPDGKYLDPPDTGYSSATNYQFPGLPYQTVKPSSTANTTVNPNNFFATDWVLGRVATLLVPSPTSATPPITSYFSYNSGTKAQWSSASGVAISMIPLDIFSKTTDTAGTTWQENFSRLDVANTSISNFSQQLVSFLTNSGAGTDWYNHLGMGPLGPPSAAVTRHLFQCNPFVTTAVSTTTTKQQRVARTSPYFLKGCTQFTVEFAGDFVKQDNDPGSGTYGEVTDFVTTANGNADGIDYQLFPPAGVSPVPARSNWIKCPRWYGLPRNVDGATIIPGNSGAVIPSTAAGATVDAATLTQVVPLRDVVATSTTAQTTLKNALSIVATPAAAWIERSVPAATSDYSGVTTGSTAMINGADYLVAWGPDSDAAGIPRPKMIRITVTLDDPNGRLSDGQTYQYVYTLP